MPGPQILSAEQVLLTTLVVKLAVMAALATVLVRHRRFRHILIFERRGWTDRLLLAMALGLPLTAGVASRLLLNYNAADLTLEGAFVVGLIVGAVVGLPPLANGEFIALPFAIGCGFAGGGLRELCPKEAIWHFSPFIVTRLPVRAWYMLRRRQIDWQLVLLMAPVGLELVRQALGFRWSNHQRLFYLHPEPFWTLAVILLATVLAVATPIKIWNNARIEHRLEEQEKLLLAARIEALSNRINPHFLFNTLTSISSLIRTQPDTARMLITKLSGLLRRLMRSTDHFVTLREELESIDQHLDIEVVRFGPQLQVIKEVGAGTLDLIIPSMLLQPIIENSIKHGLMRKVGGGRITIRTERRGDRTLVEVHDDGLGMTKERLATALTGGIGLSNVNERLRTIYGTACTLKLSSRAGAGTSVSVEIPDLTLSERITA